MSRTLAQALMVSRRNDRKERPLPQPTNGSNSSVNINTSPPTDFTYNERYYQAQIAHLQTSMAKQNVIFVRVTIGFGILVLVMLAVILFLLLRPANCDHVGHRFNIPIFSPWTSAHEKEQYTSSGWSLTSVGLLTTISLLVWQNRNALMIPLMELATNQMPMIRQFLGR
ncbi:hypothetical protein FRC15_003488 [Serendipita sp. 397]|nr:hypothetical protein FRC15_003488 [Serendipita sp. 397]